jgi:hypothetical protein
MKSWYLIPEVIECIAHDIGKKITEEQILEAAANGVIRLAVLGVGYRGAVSWIPTPKAKEMFRRGFANLSDTPILGEKPIHDAHVITQRDVNILRADYCAPMAAKEKGEIDTTGLVNWQATVLENKQEIPEMYPRLTGDDIARWCKTHGPRDVFPADQTKKLSVRWIDKSKTPHDVAVRTIRTRLSKWRKDGIFPPKK